MIFVGGGYGVGILKLGQMEQVTQQGIRLATVWSWNLKNWVRTWTGPQVRGSGPAFHGTRTFC